MKRSLNESTKQVRNVLSKHGLFLLALSMVLGSVSRLLHYVFDLLGDSDCQLVVAHSKPSRSFEAIVGTARAK